MNTHRPPSILEDEINLESIIEDDQQSKVVITKRKLKNLIKKLRSSRRDSKLEPLLIQFNLNVGIVEKIIAILRAKIRELKHNRDEIVRLRKRHAERRYGDELPQSAELLHYHDERRYRGGPTLCR